MKTTKKDKQKKSKVAKIISNKGVIIDTSDEAFSGGIIIDLVDRSKN